jgi:hypothetical protein
MFSMMTSPNPLQETRVAPSIWRSKSYVTFVLRAGLLHAALDQSAGLGRAFS